MKDGKHTTEFWIAVIFIAFSAVISLFLSAPCAFASASIVAAAYIYGRKLIKSSMIVHGDYVGGDSVEVDDIKEAEGVAIGRDSGVRTNS